MKKILFTTTALVAATLVAADAQAQTKKKVATKSVTSIESTRYLQNNDMMGPSVLKATVGGYANWFVGYADNDVSAQKNEFDVMGDAEVHFNFEAALKNGLKVGATAQLITDTTNEAGNIDQTYMYMQNKYGKVMVGRHDNVNKQLSVHATDVGAMDIQETEFTRFVIPSNNEVALKTTYFTTDAELTKLSYISPVWNGFQAGVTYAPAGGTTKDDVAGNLSGNYDSTVLSAVYSSTVENVGFAISAGYAFNEAHGNSNDLDQYNIGGRVMFKGLTVSAAFKSIEPQNATADSKVFDVGMMYETGPYAMSVAYIAGEVEGNEDDTNSTLLFSGKYNMAAGVDAFATVGFGDYEIGNAKNDGWAAITGMMLSF